MNAFAGSLDAAAVAAAVLSGTGSGASLHAGPFFPSLRAAPEGNVLNSFAGYTAGSGHSPASAHNLWLHSVFTHLVNLISKFIILTLSQFKLITTQIKQTQIIISLIPRQIFGRPGYLLRASAVSGVRELALVGRLRPTARAVGSIFSSTPSDLAESRSFNSAPSSQEGAHGDGQGLRVERSPSSGGGLPKGSLRLLSGAAARPARRFVQACFRIADPLGLGLGLDRGRRPRLPSLFAAGHPAASLGLKAPLSRKAIQSAPSLSRCIGAD